MADAKITALTALTSVDGADLVAIVDDVAGTPITKKITVTNLTAGSQPLDATLTALAALDNTAGLLEQTGADTFARRAMGVGASTSVPTRADADARYAPIVLVPLTLTSTGTGVNPLTVDGFAGQTADIFRVRTSASANILSARADGTTLIGTTVCMRGSTAETVEFFNPTLAARAQIWGLDLRAGTGAVDGIRLLGATAQVALGSAATIDWSSTTGSTATKDVGFKRAAAGLVQVTDGTSGSGKLRYAGAVLLSTGAAAVAGEATLVGGTVTVNTTAATSTALVFLQRKTAGGTIGFSTTITRTAGTSFTITSDNALDTSVYMWRIVEVY